ncbi:MAG: DUF72 domain-containing protein [Nitrososphaera sp.]
MPSNRYLRYYSQVFDFVEIDSSFYHSPTPLMTEKWSKMTPVNFRFAAKVPKSITHKSRLGRIYELQIDVRVLESQDDY